MVKCMISGCINEGTTVYKRNDDGVSDWRTWQDLVYLCPEHSIEHEKVDLLFNSFFIHIRDTSKRVRKRSNGLS